MHLRGRRSAANTFLMLIACSVTLLGSTFASTAWSQTCANKACHWYQPFTESSQADLFYNFYVPNTQGAAAAAYPAPYPTPSLVGHTYFTYQPLMPHEFLYHHRRTYHQYHNAGMGMTRASVHWYGTPVRSAAKSVRKFLSLAR